MKILTQEEFANLEGTVLYAETWPPKEGYPIDEIGAWHIVTERWEKKQFLSLEVLPKTLSEFISTPAYTKEHMEATKLLQGGENLPYDVAACRLYPGCWHDNNKFLVMDDKDIKTMLTHLMTAFPDQAAEVAYTLGISRQHEDLD